MNRQFRRLGNLSQWSQTRRTSPRALLLQDRCCHPCAVSPEGGSSSLLFTTLWSTQDRRYWSTLGTSDRSDAATTAWMAAPQDPSAPTTRRRGGSMCWQGCSSHLGHNKSHNNDASPARRRRSSSSSAPPQTRMLDATTMTMRRSYHATPRREILPVLAVGAALVLGRYGYKAWQRMESEREEYVWQLQQYEKQLAREGTLPGIVLALDMGSLYAKWATNRTVIVSHEGDRAVFNGVWYDNDHNDRNSGSSPLSEPLRSRAALERYFYERDGGDRCGVQLPWRHLIDPASNSGATSQTVSDAMRPALHEILDRLNETLTRPVLAAPAAVAGNGTAPYQAYHDALRELLGSHPTERPAVVLPEPVAAILGAQAQGLLPGDDDKAANASTPQTTLVIDVGALVSQVSVVRRDVVLASVALPWGGERYVRSAIDLLLEESPIPLVDARSLSALQVQARAAVWELTTQPRSTVRVPYLFPTPGAHHLDASLSRPVLEQAVQNEIRATGGLLEDPEAPERMRGVLSPHLPPPVDLSSLLLSSVTQVLEDGRLLPSNLDRVLVVGGGSKPPLVAQSVQSALFALMGGDAASKLVMPRDPTLPAELTVMGASTMLPSFDYSPELGLQRMS